MYRLFSAIPKTSNTWLSSAPIRIGLGLLEQRCPDAVPCDAHDELLDAVPWAFASGALGVGYGSWSKPVVFGGFFGGFPGRHLRVASQYRFPVFLQKKRYNEA